MIYVCVDCPICGQENEVDETLKSFFCLKCGSKCNLEYEDIFEPDDDALKTPTTTSDEEAEKRLKRAFLFIEDGNWDRAWSYCESVLDYDPENAEAYLAELLVTLRLHSINELKTCEKDYRGNPLYKKVLRFANKGFCLQLVEEENRYESNLTKAAEELRLQRENEKNQTKYQQAKQYMESGSKPDWSDSTRRYLLRIAIEWFDSLGSFEDSEELAGKCRQMEESL